mmetsp:Transcript_32417/g.103731  ORF Transcript_32417/g.103731 Transcript_32417/m.103731 type:complete len:228 (-) Transcript_32417:1138-1821(-)
METAVSSRSVLPKSRCLSHAGLSLGVDLLVWRLAVRHDGRLDAPNAGPDLAAGWRVRRDSAAKARDVRDRNRDGWGDREREEDAQTSRHSIGGGQEAKEERAQAAVHRVRDLGLEVVEDAALASRRGEAGGVRHDGAVVAPHRAAQHGGGGGVQDVKTLVRPVFDALVAAQVDGQRDRDREHDGHSAPGCACAERAEAGEHKSDSRNDGGIRALEGAPEVVGHSEVL